MVKLNLRFVRGDDFVTLVKARSKLCVRPATPETVVPCWSRGRQRLLLRCSDMKEANEAESSKARAFTTEPSGALTRS